MKLLLFLLIIINQISIFWCANSLEFWLWHDQVPYKIVKKENLLLDGISGPVKKPLVQGIVNPLTPYVGVDYRLSLTYRVDNNPLSNFFDVIGNLQFNVTTKTGGFVLNTTLTSSDYSYSRTNSLSIRTYYKQNDGNPCELEGFNWSLIESGNFTGDWDTPCILVYIKGYKQLKDVVFRERGNRISNYEDPILITMQGIKECMFVNPTFSNISLVRDGFSSSYNAFGWAAQTPDWINLRTLEDAEKFTARHGYVQTSCSTIQDSDLEAVVLFCKHSEAEGCVMSYNENNGAYFWTGAAHRSGLGHHWCMKFGYGPLLCTPEIDFTLSGYCSDTGLMWGRPGLCMKRIPKNFVHFY